MIHVVNISNSISHTEKNSGKPRVSYRDVEGGQIASSGLPDGISLKRPSSYGRANLVKILKSRDLIVIQGMVQGSSLGWSVGGTQVQTHHVPKCQ